MKIIAEYLEHAINFERMAGEETNPDIKAVSEKQTLTYRKVAADRSSSLAWTTPATWR
jgi:hypothetical protein